MFQQKFQAWVCNLMSQQVNTISLRLLLIEWSLFSLNLLSIAPPSFIDYASQPPPYQPLAKSNEMSLNASMPHTVVNVSNQPASVVYVGGCPSCRVSIETSEFLSSIH